MKNEENGIEQILTGSEEANLGADPTCAFMLEARKGFYFTESYEGDLIKHISAEDVKREPKYTLAAHGYSPQKPDYSTLFMAAGKGVSSGQIIPNMHLVDIGPTLAAMLGLSLENRWKGNRSVYPVKRIKEVRYEFTNKAGEKLGFFDDGQIPPIQLSL